MSRQRPLALLVALLLAVALAAGSACSFTDPAALSVDGRTLSRSDLMSELNALADDSAALQAIFGVGPDATAGVAPGTYNTGFTAAVLQRHVVADLLEQIAAAEGLELTDADLAEAEAFVGQQVPEMGGFEKVIARIVALDELLAPVIPAEELNRLLMETVGGVEVTVDGQFGMWDPANLQVVPPEGPMLPPVADEGALLEDLLSSLQGGS